MEAPASPQSSRPQIDDVLAFEAMRRFLENWWIRSGRPNHSVWEQGDVLWLLSALEPQQDNKPADPAMWSDWELALRQVMEERQSGQSQDG